MRVRIVQRDMTRRLVLTSLASQVAVGLRAFSQSPSEPLHGESELASRETHVPFGSHDVTVWGILNQGLEDGDVEHRKRAITALATIGPVHEAVQMIEKGLQDKDALVRQTAAAALGESGAKEAIPYLKAALDDSPEVSFTAAKALWDLGDSSAREIFQQVIEGERKDTPGKMRGAMRDAKRRLRPTQLALMGAKEAAGLFGPASMGLDAVQEVMKEAKKDSGSPGRTVAAGILAKDSDPYALTLLEWALGDNSSTVRVAVAKALGERGNQDTIPKLTPLLADDRHAVRYMAAAAIIKLNLKQPAPAGN
jgi:HEAT repeat protein